MPYRHLDGKPRECFNQRGEPKPRLTNAEAIGKALEYDYERKLDPERRDRGPVGAYLCTHCSCWHVGTLSKHKRRALQREELGERVWWAMHVENRRAPDHRARTIAGRGWSAIRRAHGIGQRTSVRAL